MFNRIAFYHLLFYPFFLSGRTKILHTNSATEAYGFILLGSDSITSILLIIDHINSRETMAMKASTSLTEWPVKIVSWEERKDGTLVFHFNWEAAVWEAGRAFNEGDPPAYLKRPVDQLTVSQQLNMRWTKK